MKFLFAVICSLKAPQRQWNVASWLNEASQGLKLFLDWFIACWFSISGETNKGGVSEILIIFGRWRAQNPNFTFARPSKNEWAHNAVFFFNIWTPSSSEFPPPSILGYTGNTHKCNKNNAIWGNDECIELVSLPHRHSVL